MLFGAEIGLLIYGLLSLVRGTFNVGKGKDLSGVRARVLGAICMSPIPNTFAIGLLYGFWFASQGEDPASLAASHQGTFIAIEVGVVLATVVTVGILGNLWYATEQRDLAAAVADDE